MQTLTFKPAIQIQAPRSTTSARPCFAVRASKEESSPLPKLAAAFGAALLLATPFNGSAIAYPSNLQGYTNEAFSVAALPPPDPSSVEEDGNLPQKAPGEEIKLPPQPEAEKESAVPAGSTGQDSPGGKTSSTKSGGGILDFFGGSSSGNQPNSNLQKPSSLTIGSLSGYAEEVFSVAALPPPEPSSVEEDGNLPQKAPGEEIKLPPQPEAEKESAVPAGSTGQDSPGGKTSSTKSGGGILDFFGGSSTGKQPVSSLQKGANEVGSVSALPPPEPSAVEEDGKLPEKAPGVEVKLPPQPEPETPAPEDLGKDSAGGKTSTNAAGKAAENIKKASASLPSSSEIGQIAEGIEGAGEAVADAGETVAEVVDENKPDGIKATLIGLAFVVALEITIFTVQPQPEGKKGAH